MKSLIVAVVLGTAALACSSSSTPQTDMGTLAVGGYSIHVGQEGSKVTAGASTRFVLKAASGKPDSITGWIGLETADDATKKAAVFDANDGDFDDDVVAPNPIPTGAKYWFAVVAGGQTSVTSVDYPK